LTSTERSAA